MYFNRQKYTYFFFEREKRVSFLSLFVTCLMLSSSYNYYHMSMSGKYILLHVCLCLLILRVCVADDNNDIRYFNKHIFSDYYKHI